MGGTELSNRAPIIFPCTSTLPASIKIPSSVDPTIKFPSPTANPPIITLPEADDWIAFLAFEVALKTFVLTVVFQPPRSVRPSMADPRIFPLIKFESAVPNKRIQAASLYPPATAAASLV